MTNREAKIRALTALWLWASYLHEGHERGELSDVLRDDVENGLYTEKEAIKVQRLMIEESERIWKRIDKIKPTVAELKKHAPK